MEKIPLEIPSLTNDDFSKFLPPSLVYPGLSNLFGHYSLTYLKQIISKMNSYTWFRFVEAESKNLIFKKIATRVLYKMLNRAPLTHICAGNENGFIYGDKAFGLCSRGVNYKAVNEDGIGIFERQDALSLVVCDGVGDCLVGEVASFVILNEFENYPEKPIHSCFSDSVDVLTQLGRDLIDEIPEFITFPNEVSQAAVTAITIRDNECEIGQVGDVLLFHIRDGDMRMLNQNHKWIDMEELKKLFSDEQYLAQRHIISNAVGRNYDPYWIPAMLTLEKGDLLMLASDGLETLHPMEIQETLRNEKNLKILLETLYHKVLEANLKWNTPGAPIFTKPDNISIVIYQHEPESVEP